MITYRKRLNLVPGYAMQKVCVSQYDSDIRLEFELYTSEGTFTVESGTTVVIQGTKPDGNGISIDGTLTATQDTDTGTTVYVASFDFDVQMAAVSGKSIYELALYHGSKVLNTANFILFVEKAALDADTIQSDSVLRNLDAIIEGAATATQAAEEADDAADRAEEAARTLTIDDTLTQTGQAADAKKVGDEITDLKDDLIDTSTEIIDIFTEIPTINQTLFTTSDVEVGNRIQYHIKFVGNDVGYIGLYNSQNTIIAYYGKASYSDTETVFDGYFNVPNGFSYAKWVSNTIRPQEFSLAKIIETQVNILDNVVRFDESQTLTDTQKTQVKENIGVAEDLEQIQDDINQIIGDGTEQLAIEFVHGYGILIGDDVAIGDTVDLNNKEQWYSLKYAIVDCQGGDVFLLDDMRGATNSRAWTWLTSDNVLISRSNAGEIVTGEIVAPQNAGKVVIQGIYRQYPDDTTTDWGTAYKIVQATGNVVRFDVVQYKTEAEKARARANIGASGLSDDVKTALLACFANVEWVNDDGQDYYDALEEALNGGSPTPPTPTQEIVLTPNLNISADESRTPAVTIHSSSYRQSFGAISDEPKIIVYPDLSPSSYSMIRVPSDKTTVTVTCVTSARCNLAWFDLTDTYQGEPYYHFINQTGWQTAANTFTFDITGKDYIAINFDSSDSNSGNYTLTMS